MGYGQDIYLKLSWERLKKGALKQKIVEEEEEEDRN